MEKKNTKIEINKSLEGEIISYIEPSMAGVSRSKLIVMFVENLGLFKDERDLKLFLKKMTKNGLIASRVVDKIATYFITDKGMEILMRDGYLDWKIARHKRRKQLIRERLEYDEDGYLIESKENVFKYLKIQQLLMKEQRGKVIPIERMEMLLRISYKDAPIEELEHDIDILIKKYVEGLI
ncbi:MAG: hypothetical protein ACFFDB_00535 [Promethearchaeota archaeon]